MSTYGDDDGLGWTEAGGDIIDVLSGSSGSSYLEPAAGPPGGTCEEVGLVSSAGSLLMFLSLSRVETSTLDAGCLFITRSR